MLQHVHKEDRQDNLYDTYSEVYLIHDPNLLPSTFINNKNDTLTTCNMYALCLDDVTKKWQLFYDAIAVEDSLSILKISADDYKTLCEYHTNRLIRDSSPH